MRQEQIRIPTFAALVVVAALSISGFFAFDKFSSFLGSAHTDQISPPANVIISNITESSAVVSWQTDEPIAATIRYRIGENTMIAYDIRDTDTIAKPYRIHYVPLVNIPPHSAVTFEILLNKKSLYQNTIQMAPTATNMPQVLPVYGQLQTNLGTATEGSIISIQLQNSLLWSTFISDTTSWVLPVAPVRTGDLKAFYCQIQPCTSDTSLTITVRSEEGNSTVNLTLNEARPLANPIVIGQSYDIVNPVVIQITPSISITPIATPLVKGIQTTPARKPTPPDISILTPEEDSSLRFAKPLISGHGIPNADVTITLESSIKQIDTVKVQDNGIWVWSPKLPLEPGSHTLTIETVDKQGKKVTLTRSFSIFKSGEQILAATASPSATIMPSLTPSIRPTSTPVLQTGTVTPTPTIEMPVSASWLPSIFFIAGGLMLVLLGLAVL